MTDTDDIDTILQEQATEFERDQEVERVLKAFRLNPFDIFDLPHTASERYVPRQRSVLL